MTRGGRMTAELIDEVVARLRSGATVDDLAWWY
jgi:hypothetical protein